MKLTKKIIVAVLALALLASCFVSSAFAVDSQQTYGFTYEEIKDLDDILEYYICDTYITDTYDEEADKVYEEISVDNPILAERFFELYDCLDYDGYYNHQTKISIGQNPNDAEDKVLSIDLGVDDYAKYARASEDGKAWTEKVFFTFDVYFDDTCMSNAFFEVQIKPEGKSINTVLKFDFGYGDIYYNEENPDITGPVVWYAPWEANTSNFSTKHAILEGFTPKLDTWYSVTVCFDAEGDRCSFDIAEGDQSVAGITYDIPGAAGIAAFECKGTFSRYETMFWEYIEDYENPIHALMYLDDVSIYEGSFMRDVAMKEIVAKTTLEEIEAIFNSPDCSAEDKLTIADVFAILLEYKDDDAFIGNYVPLAEEYVNKTFVNEIVSRVGKIDTSANYYDRVAYLENDVAEYNEKFEAGVITELKGVSADEIASLNAAREVIETEKATLNTIKEHSEGFIAAINAYDPANVNYDDIVGFFTEANKDEYKLRSSDYVGVTNAEAVFEKITAKYDRMVKDVADFISYVDAIKATSTFGTYYSAYKNASVAYYKYDEMPEFENGAFINPDVDINDKINDETYAPSETVVKIREAVAYFVENEAATEALIVDCDSFNMAVLMAASSNYYPTFLELIAIADAKYAVVAEKYDYVSDYKGITEGKTLADTYATLESLKTASVNKMTATQAYIAAVNAIEAATGFYAKREAVNAALTLKIAGDNLAIEGVLEANIKLTAAEAEVNEMQGNSDSVIALVEALENADTIAERRAIIREVEKHIGGVAKDYEGVTDAIAAYNTLVVQFKADVEAANAALLSAVKNAVKF